MNEPESVNILHLAEQREGNVGESNSTPLESEAMDLEQLKASLRDAEESPLMQKFFGASDPKIILNKEQAHHRIIVVLKAQGFSNVEIARQLGVTPPMVAYTVRQPWAQDMLRETIGGAGASEVEVILSGAVADSVRKLIDLRDDENAPKETQRKCANDLLDRVFGRPNQPISHSQVDPNSMSDAELMELAKKGAKN